MRPISYVSSDRGLTLIEISVAILLVAVLIAVAVPAFRAATDADLHAAAIRIAAGNRACFGEASVKNVTLRMAYDLGAGTYWVEGVPGTFQVIQKERDREEVLEEEKKKEEEEQRKRELAERYGTGEMEESIGSPQPKFVPVQMAFLEPQRLPSGVKFAGVRTPQFRKVVKEGTVYTHFFPNGWAERTLVYLEDSGGSKVTLEMEPLTGRLVLHEGELDYREIDQERERGG